MQRLEVVKHSLEQPALRPLSSIITKTSRTEGGNQRDLIIGLLFIILLIQWFELTVFYLLLALIWVSMDGR